MVAPPTDRAGRRARRRARAHPPRRPARRAIAGALAALLLAMPLASCGVGRATDDDAASVSDPSTEEIEARERMFLEVTPENLDQRLDDRVAQVGLPGAALVVESLEGQDHLHTVGAVDLGTEVALAETSMWLTAAVILTLVDDGTLALDEPIGPFLPWLSGPAASITVRQLLSHTSGLPPTVACEEPTPDSCDAAVAAAELLSPPGEGFHVSELDAHVAARLAEAATGLGWAELSETRIAAPTGMQVTRYADPATTGGLVAVDGTTTPEDLGRFLAMIRDDGAVDGVQVLSADVVREMLLDQTVRLDTHTEPWVSETGVPTYGLGVWRDRLRGDEAASVVSAPNRYGLYPFVDDGRSAWGIVVVEDTLSPRADAVSASALIAQLTAAVLRRPAD